MPQCPQCKRDFVELPRKCTSCMADLDLLVEYVGELNHGLEQASQLTRAGELGRAVWVYLSVLEMDPDNPTARKQVGEVATAVRQFDRTTPARRWLFRLRGEDAGDETTSPAWMRWLMVAVLLFVFTAVGFGVGVLVGHQGTDSNGEAPISPARQNNTATGN